MRIYRGFGDSAIRLKPRAIAIGVFDGVHLGHRKILSKMLAAARRLKASPCVVTFDPHPERVLFPGRQDAAVLSSLEHRLQLFRALGIKECVIVRFDAAFSKISAKKFLENCLVRRLGMRSLCVGRGFRFGSRAQGDEAMLAAEATRLQYAFNSVSPLCKGGAVISSTRIRRLILKGAIRSASALLGRAYSIIGTVVVGKGRGRRLGFPTANLDPHHEILPPEGVYAAIGKMDGKRRAAVVHIGKRPTFLDHDKAVEVHFIDFHKSIYGKEIELEFKSKIRRVRHFPSETALKTAILSDIRKAQKLLFALHA